MLDRLQEKLKDVPDEDLVTPVKALMNLFRTLKKMKQDDPDLDLAESNKRVRDMGEVEFRAAVWDGCMYFLQPLAV